jgi:hypothetical protein
MKRKGIDRDGVADMASKQTNLRNSSRGWPVASSHDPREDKLCSDISSRKNKAVELHIFHSRPSPNLLFGASVKDIAVLTSLHDILLCSAATT